MSGNPAATAPKVGCDALSAAEREELAAFRRAVEEAFPGRVAEVTLFGSRARGDAGPDSDYDLAVFLRDLHSDWDTIGTLSDVAYEFALKGMEIRTLALPADYLTRPGGQTALAFDISRDGVAV